MIVRDFLYPVLVATATTASLLLDLHIDLLVVRRGLGPLKRDRNSLNTVCLILVHFFAQSTANRIEKRTEPE